VAWLLNLVGLQIAKEKKEKKEKEWKTVGPRSASARTIQVRLQRVQDQLAVAVQSGRQGSVEAHLRRLGWIAATVEKRPPLPLQKLAVRQQMLAKKVEDDDDDDEEEEEEEDEEDEDEDDEKEEEEDDDAMVRIVGPFRSNVH